MKTYLRILFVVFLAIPATNYAQKVPGSYPLYKTIAEVVHYSTTGGSTVLDSFVG